MCKCTPEIRTPWCDKPGCETPKQDPPPPAKDVRITGLVLTRKLGEVVLIETPKGNIEVEVIKFMGGAVRLRFTSPEDINIARREAYKPGYKRSIA